MNKDQLKTRISANLLKVREKKIECTAAVEEICEAFRAYAKRHNDGRVLDGIEKRVREALQDFLEDVDPVRPGVAIHDAIDHMFHG